MCFTFPVTPITVRGLAPVGAAELDAVPERVLGPATAAAPRTRSRARPCRGVGRLSLGERVPAEDRDAHRREVLRRNDIPVAAWHHLRIRWDVIRIEHAVRSRLPRGRLIRGRDSHAGKRCHALAQAIVMHDHRRIMAVARSRRVISSVKRCVGSKPALTERAVSDSSQRAPALTRSVAASATSTTTNGPRRHGYAAGEPPPGAQVDPKVGAGPRAAETPIASARTITIAETAPNAATPKWIADSLGNACGNRLTRSGTASHATSTPPHRRAPTTNPRDQLTEASRRVRAQPDRTRTLPVATARASCRLATFATAMSSTSNTAALSASNAGLNGA